MSKPFTDFETEWNDEVAAHAAFRARVAKLLQRIQYVSQGCGQYCDGGGDGDVCPSCGYYVSHTPDCELAALLKEVS